MVSTRAVNCIYCMYNHIFLIIKYFLGWKNHIRPEIIPHNHENFVRLARAYFRFDGFVPRLPTTT